MASDVFMAEADYGVSHMGLHIDSRYRRATVNCMSSAGQRIRELRRAKELTQPQLASAVGINQSTLSDIERGAGFSAEILMRLAEHLEAPPEFIMRGTSSIWPMRLEMARFLALSPADRAYVEGKFDAAVESREMFTPTATDSRTQQQTDGRVAVRKGPPARFPGEVISSTELGKGKQGAVKANQLGEASPARGRKRS